MIRSRAFDNIIFDLDGTLTDPQEGFVNCINFALTSLDNVALPAQTLLPFIGPHIHGTFQRLLDTTNPPRSKRRSACTVDGWARRVSTRMSPTLVWPRC